MLALQEFGEEADEAYGVIKNQILHRVGNANPIGERDLFIAAHAVSLGAVLVSHNVREFAAVPGLVVEDWETG